MYERTIHGLTIWIVAVYAIRTKLVLTDTSTYNRRIWSTGGVAIAAKYNGLIRVAVNEKKGISILQIFTISE